jgi:hypothetical protein
MWEKEADAPAAGVYGVYQQQKEPPRLLLQHPLAGPPPGCVSFCGDENCHKRDGSYQCKRNGGCV